MNLWIRSQDKKSLSKINEDIVVIGTCVRKLLNNENCWTDLGKYITEARALEVLYEIQNKISEYKMVDIGYHSEFICNNIVYEMPKE